MEITENTYRNVNYCLRCGAKLELGKDKEEKLRPQCTVCGWVYYKNPIPASACVVLNGEGEILIIKRLVEPKPNEWALPSGYIEINQSPEEAAVDEMLEETGLQGRVVKFLGFYDGYSPIYEKVLSFGFLMEITGGILEAGDDAGEAKFVSLENLPPLAFASHRYFVEMARELIKEI